MMITLSTYQGLSKFLPCHFRSTVIPSPHDPDVLLGSYAEHTDPIVRGNLVSLSVCQCVSMSVCQCVTLRTRRHVTRRLLAGRLGTSNSKLFRRPLLLPSCCCGCVLNCSRFLCVWKIFKSFPSQISSVCSR